MNDTKKMLDAAPKRLPGERDDAPTGACGVTTPDRTACAEGLTESACREAANNTPDMISWTWIENGQCQWT